MWQWHGMIGTAELFFNNSQQFYIPPGCDVDALAEAVRHVLGRHDALRTVFRIDGDRLLGQVIEGAGEFTLDVYDAGPRDPRDVAAEVGAELSTISWDCRQWPIRAAVVTDGRQQPAALVFAYNRLVVDTQSLDFVQAEVLKTAFGDPNEETPRWQPLEAAEFEQSPEGSAITARALEYWRDNLVTAPPSIFDFDALPTDESRYVMAEMASRPMAAAVRILRRRWRVTGGTLVLSAFAVALKSYTGHPQTLVGMFAGNRGDRDRRHLLGTLISEGLLRIDVREASFEQVTAQTSRASRAAHEFGYCDPTAVDELRREIELGRGAALDLTVFFNDMQTGQTTTDDDPEPTVEELRELVHSHGVEAPGSTALSPEQWVGWDTSWQAKVTRKEIRLLLTAQHGPDLPVMLSCDTKYLGRETIRELLVGLERVLVEAACGESDVEQLGRLSGVRPARRGPSWVRYGASRVDLAATQELWQQVAGPRAGAVLAQELPAPELVAFVTGDTAPSFTDLHRAFVDALQRRNDVQAPSSYRWVAAAPADPGDPAAWQAATVRAQSDGRG